MEMPVNLSGWLFLFDIIFASILWFMLGKRWNEFDEGQKLLQKIAGEFYTYKKVSELQIKNLEENHNRELRILSEGIHELNLSVNEIKEELKQNQKERYDELKSIINQLKSLNQ